MVQPKIATEDLLLPITKKCESLKKQTHTKRQETLEFKLIKLQETFSFEPSIILSFDSNWIVGLTGLEVRNSIFKITGEKTKIELYADTFDKVS